MDKIKVIKSETESLLKKMIDKFDVEVATDEETYQVVIKTDDEAPTVIGRHGETIKAIQKILEVMLYKEFGESVEILVNVNDYRERQRERLEQLAKNSAERVRDTGSPSYLKGLSSYERKIIHEYVVANFPELSSYSVGEGSDRRLVINLKENEGKEDAS
jgi:spoIIIJ-associated protein